MLKYWLWLSLLEKLPNQAKHRLLRHFETPEQLWLADRERLSLLSEEVDLSAPEDRDLQAAERTLDACYRKNISILTWQDAAYPQRLRCIDDPPLVLYYRGTLPDLDSLPVIAVVGTRKASGYGMVQAKQFGFRLTQMGAVIISGGAAGVDTMALRGAMSAGGRVVAVLGCGADVAYPAKNRTLFRDIAEHGCLISEYPPGTEPASWHFPMRNRILSALSLGVLVVEAPIKSGALITADYALEQGKDVFAIPANLGLESCLGNIRLLKDGAIAVEEAWDVMKEYEHLFPDAISPKARLLPMTLTEEELRLIEGPPLAEVASPKIMVAKSDRKNVDKTEKRSYIDLSNILDTLSPDEKQVALLLQRQPLLADELSEQTKLSAGRVLAALTLLELKGLVIRQPAKRYSLAEK